MTLKSVLSCSRRWRAGVLAGSRRSSHQHLVVSTRNVRVLLGVIFCSKRRDVFEISSLAVSAVCDVAADGDVALGRHQLLRASSVCRARSSISVRMDLPTFRAGDPPANDEIDTVWH